MTQPPGQYEQALTEAALAADPELCTKGYVDEAILLLCRHLKGACRNGEGPDDLQVYFDLWFKKYEYQLDCYDCEDAWVSFCVVWDKAKFPIRDTLAIATARVKSDCIIWRPELAGLSPKLRLIGQLCYELQQLLGDEDFFLSAENAGKVIGVNKSQGGDYLKQLQAKKVVELTRRGFTGRASHYRYVGNNSGQKDDK
jgi:hypothetical protein